MAGELTGYRSPDLGRRMAAQVAGEIARIIRDGLHHPTHRAVLDAVAEIPGNDELSLLDVGCGAGLYCRVLRYAGRPIRYEGVDFNTVMLDQAGKLFPGVTFHLADARELPFEDGSYDIVLMGAILEHVVEWKDALTEACRVARGWLVLHRTLITLGGLPTRYENQKAFDVAVPRVYLDAAELEDELMARGFAIVGSRFVCYDGGRRRKGEQWTFLCEKPIRTTGASMT